MKLNEDNEVKIIGIIVKDPTEVRYLLYKLIGEALVFSLKMSHQISYSHTLPPHPYL
jgi:hypothetical protein